MMRSCVSLLFVASVLIASCAGKTEPESGGGGASGGKGGGAGSGAGGSGGGGVGGALGQDAPAGALPDGAAGANQVSDAAARETAASDGPGDAGVPTMSFFVTSKGSGKGGDFGGLAGADAHCKALATVVSAPLGAKTWRAYLSTSTVKAATRIGNGPWYNARGVLAAGNLTDLHDGQGTNGSLNKTWPIGEAAFDLVLDEKGNKHENAVHDILTGSNMAGAADGSNHCSNWTSQVGNSTVGHSNRSGGGRPPSWNSAHTVGCGSELDTQGKLVNRVSGTVTSGGGRGSIYCFASD